MKKEIDLGKVIYDFKEEVCREQFYRVKNNGSIKIIEVNTEEIISKLRRILEKNIVDEAQYKALKIKNIHKNKKDFLFKKFELSNPNFNYSPEKTITNSDETIYIFENNLKI